MTVPPGPNDGTTPQQPTPPPNQPQLVPGQHPIPQASLASSTVNGAKSFWQDDTNRLMIIIGGIFMVVVLLLGMITTAAIAVRTVAGANDGPHRMIGRGGDGEQGPRGGHNGMMGKQGQRGEGMPGGMRGADGFPGVQHGDVVVTGVNGQAETKRIARGSVASVTPTTLVVKSADGYESTFTIAPTTQITGSGQSGTAATLAAGQTVFAVGTVAGTVATADRVAISPV